MQNFQILCRIRKHVNSAKHRIAIVSKTETGRYGSSTVLQQVNVQSDQQCKWTDSWGVWSQNWEGLRGVKISPRTATLHHYSCRLLALISIIYTSILYRGGTGARQLPVPAGYCTTRHYPDPAGYYFKIWPDPDLGNLSRFLRLSTIPHAVKRKVGMSCDSL